MTFRVFTSLEARGGKTLASISWMNALFEQGSYTHKTILFVFLSILFFVKTFLVTIEFWPNVVAKLVVQIGLHLGKRERRSNLGPGTTKTAHAYVEEPAFSLRFHTILLRNQDGGRFLLHVYEIFLVLLSLCLVFLWSKEETQRVRQYGTNEERS